MLFTPDGRPSGIFICEKCSKVSRVQELAEECCKQKMCACGSPITTQYSFTCDPCRKLKELEREQLDLDKALEVDLDKINWHAAYYSDAAGGYGEGYADDMEIMLDIIAQNLDELEPEDRPKEIIIWQCKRMPLCDFNSDVITDRIELIDGLEDYEFEGLDELDEALRRFNEANKIYYFHNPKEIYVRLPLDHFQLDQFE